MSNPPPFPGTRGVGVSIDWCINGNHHLYFDNFFSSYKLMKDMLGDNIYATATTRSNRKDFPQELKEVKLSCGELLVVQRNSVTASTWQDKK